METILFGPAAKRLYGVLHEPEGTTVSDFAFLICYPFGQEYMISHRAAQTLCKNLSRAGVPCMRFDYAGTGDSYTDDFSLAACVENTLEAVQKLTDYTGLDVVKVAGLRLGAAVASLAAERSGAIKSVVLWDPVVNGKTYLDEITSDSSSVTKTGETTWVNGYEITLAFKTELEALNLHNINYQSLEALRFVFSQSSPEAEKLIQSLNQNNSKQKIDQVTLDDVKSWVQVDENGSFVLPHRVLKQIQEWMLT